MINLQRIISALIKRKIVKENNCWILDLITDKTDGYYKIRVGNKKYYAHRISAAYYLGLNYENKKELACHKDICKTKACWNPEHLYVGNHSSNLEDAMRAGSNVGGNNRDKTHCPRGHEYNEKNTIIRKNSRACRKCASLYSK